MTYALLALAVVVAGLLAWRLYRLPAALAARGIAQSLGALSTDPKASEPSIYAASFAKPLEERKAGDYYDPATERVEMAFNEFGFITTPLPAPVDPATGRVPMTKAEVEAMTAVAAAAPIAKEP